MKQKIFPFLIALSALAVSGSAAFYSITIKQMKYLIKMDLDLLIL